MKKRRTFGWVQNPNKLSTLKDIVACITPNSYFNNKILKYRLPILLKNMLLSRNDYNSFVEILQQPQIQAPYDKLKGKGPGKSCRKNAICTGIIQAAITAQSNIDIIDLNGNKIKTKKPYTDDWTADGYIRWGISTGFLEYNKEHDTVSITDLGKELVTADSGSIQEREAFSYGLLSYPPVIRILQLLSDGKVHTKFELGKNLGFEGEMGFTSIPQNIFISEYSKAANPSRIRSNLEGDADKYARTIANWLKQMEWVTNCSKVVSECCFGETFENIKISGYRITSTGLNALKRAFGYSSHPKIPRIITFEMLATKVPDAEYLRNRRALILFFLKAQSPKSYEAIQKHLSDHNINISIATIKDDINGFKRIGVTLDTNEKVVKLVDKITGLKIPQENFIPLDISTQKDRIRQKLKWLDHRYLKLIDLAYSDASSRAKKNADAREFELETTSLFVDELEFNGMHLGDSNKPDVIISKGKYGTIIDNKSYKDGFSVDRKNADEMIRYVLQNKNRIPGEPSNEWWNNFSSNVSVFTFLFITSFLTKDFSQKLQSISLNTGTMGGAVAVDNLLYIADNIKGGKISREDFFTMMKNCELKATWLSNCTNA